MKSGCWWKAPRRPWPLALALALPLALTQVAFAPTARAEAPDADALAQADKDYAQAIHFARTGRARGAIQYFERALPYRNATSDIFYNLVHACEAANRWTKLNLYAQGFLFLEPNSADARDIARKLQHARRRLARIKTPLVPYTFDIAPRGLVFVDDVPVASDTSTLVQLTPGKWSLRAEAPEFEPWRTEITVVEGQPQTIERALDKTIYTGLLAIRTTPAEGVKVFVDDALVGATPLKEPLKLKTLKYLIRFEKAGYDDWSRYVTISRDETYQLTPVMEKSSRPADKAPETPPPAP